MPFTQNDIKYLRRRKYCEFNSERINIKLQFDLETKTILESNCEDYGRSSTEENGLSAFKAHEMRTKSMMDLGSSVEMEKLESEDKSLGSWNFFSLTDIPEETEDLKYSVYLNGETMDDLGKLGSNCSEWRYEMKDAAFEQICSIQCYQF